ncbi:hypothetical protein HK102_011865, partial [Quaeritorhiza haematococci]
SIDISSPAAGEHVQSNTPTSTAGAASRRASSSMLTPANSHNGTSARKDKKDRRGQIPPLVTTTSPSNGQTPVGVPNVSPTTTAKAGAGLQTHPAYYIDPVTGALYPFPASNAAHQYFDAASAPGNVALVDPSVPMFPPGGSWYYPAPFPLHPAAAAGMIPYPAETYMNYPVPNYLQQAGTSPTGPNAKWRKGSGNSSVPPVVTSIATTEHHSTSEDAVALRIQQSGDVVDPSVDADDVASAAKVNSATEGAGATGNESEPNAIAGQASASLETCPTSQSGATVEDATTEIVGPNKRVLQQSYGHTQRNEASQSDSQTNARTSTTSSKDDHAFQQTVITSSAEQEIHADRLASHKATNSDHVNLNAPAGSSSTVPISTVSVQYPSQQANNGTLGEISITTVAHLPPHVNTNVYVRGLANNMSDELFYNICTGFGKVISSKAILDLRTNECKGYGFAMYETEAEARVAMEGLAKLGYEVSFAKESFNSRLKNLQDAISTNIYLSNLPLDMTETPRMNNGVPPNPMVSPGGGTARYPYFASPFSQSPGRPYGHTGKSPSAFTAAASQSETSGSAGHPSASRQSGPSSHSIRAPPGNSVRHPDASFSQYPAIYPGITPPIYTGSPSSGSAHSTGVSDAGPNSSSPVSNAKGQPHASATTPPLAPFQAYPYVYHPSASPYHPNPYQFPPYAGTAPPQSYYVPPSSAASPANTTTTAALSLSSDRSASSSGTPTEDDAATTVSGSNDASSLSMMGGAASFSDSPTSSLMVPGVGPMIYPPLAHQNSPGAAPPSGASPSSASPTPPAVGYAGMPYGYPTAGYGGAYGGYSPGAMLYGYNGHWYGYGPGGFGTGEGGEGGGQHGLGIKDNQGNIGDSTETGSAEERDVGDDAQSVVSGALSGTVSVAAATVGGDSIAGSSSFGSPALSSKEELSQTTNETESVDA